MNKFMELLKKTYPFSLFLMPFAAAAATAMVVRFITFLVGATWPFGGEGQAFVGTICFLAAIGGAIAGVALYVDNRDRRR